jgi:nitrous oxidase accessory protein NosD
LFIGTCVIPSVTSQQLLSRNIITVDDDGGGDYTSIKDAVNNSSPGDTIEVYSGTYFEELITIDKENITLIGISHDLGGGNDTGQPFISGNETTLQVKTSHVTVSNFRIEKSDESGVYDCCIFLGGNVKTYQGNITVSNCTLIGGGIYCQAWGQDILVKDNNISHCGSSGINFFYTQSFTITRNIITDVRLNGIFVAGEHHTISANIIKRCEIGIKERGEYNQIYGNDIENCSVGVYPYEGYGNIISKNNFKNYSKTEFWWVWYLGFYKNKWQRNYWDSWKGIGPQRIPGILVLWIPVFFIDIITIPIPWYEFDWHPAQEPYDIPGMS